MQRATIENMLNSVDIRINGTRAWDMQVHREQLFQRIARRGSLGLGEAYMDGWWDCEALDEATCCRFAIFNRENGELDEDVCLAAIDHLKGASLTPRGEEFGHAIEFATRFLHIPKCVN